jgi:hypothetical protein
VLRSVIRTLIRQPESAPRIAAVARYPDDTTGAAQLRQFHPDDAAVQRCNHRFVLAVEKTQADVAHRAVRAQHLQFFTREHVAAGAQQAGRLDGADAHQGQADRLHEAHGSAQNGAVRRHCQTTQGPAGSPVRRSHTTTLSRWLAMPMAATGGSPAFSRQASTASRTLVHSSRASCSTHAGCG